MRPGNLYFKRNTLRHESSVCLQIAEKNETNFQIYFLFWRGSFCNFCKDWIEFWVWVNQKFRYSYFLIPTLLLIPPVFTVYLFLFCGNCVSQESMWHFMIEVMSVMFLFKGRWMTVLNSFIIWCYKCRLSEKHFEMSRAQCMFSGL